MRNTVLLTLLILLGIPLFAAAAPANSEQCFTENLIKLDNSTEIYLLPSLPAPVPFSTKYVGDAKTHVFHTEKCPYVKKLSGRYKVYFALRVDAEKDGFRPCPTCRP